MRLGGGDSSSTHGSKIPPRIAEGNLSSGRNQPPAAFPFHHSLTSVRSDTTESKDNRAHLQLPRISWVLVEDAVEQGDYASNQNADEGQPPDAGRPATFFLKHDGERPEQQLDRKEEAGCQLSRIWFESGLGERHTYNVPMIIAMLTPNQRSVSITSLTRHRSSKRGLTKSPTRTRLAP